MRRKPFLLLLAILIFSSCVKQTIDFDKISGEVALSPGVVVSAVKGTVSLADIIEPNDTIVFDDGLLKIVFSQDSLIDFQLEDFFDALPGATFENTVPIAAISVSDIRDTIDIDPGDDIKIKEMKMSSGSVAYTFTSWCSFDVQLDLLAPSIDDGGSPLSESIIIYADGTVNGEIDLTNTIVELNTDPAQAYNRIPMEYDITVLNAPPGYDPGDSVKVLFEFSEHEFDYAIGYFGLFSEDIESEIMDLGMEDIFSRITGSVHLSSPGITVNYDNSFGLPMRIEFEAIGRNDSEEVSLDRGPIDIMGPTSADNRDISASFSIDKDNSELPELISMLPYEIEFFGGASINPDGETAVDNILFGDSRFVAGIEVEVPLEFRINNLQLADTMDNFLVGDDEGEDEDSPLDNLSELKLRLYLENGFPLGASLNIELYDSLSGNVLETLSTGDLFTAANVDGNGRVTEPAIGTCEIEFTEDFLAAVNDADKIIVSFTLNTSNGGTTDVKIYSDYSILFKVAVVIKADLDLNFNSEN